MEDKLDLNRKSVELCLNKYPESSIEVSLKNSPGEVESIMTNDNNRQ